MHVENIYHSSCNYFSDFIIKWYIFILCDQFQHVIINGREKEEGKHAVQHLAERYCKSRITFVCGDVNDCSHFEGNYSLHVFDSKRFV